MSARRSPPRLTSLGAVVVVVILGAAYYLFRGQQLIEPAPIAEAPAGGTGFLVFFTEPGSDTAETLRGGPDESLAAAIDGAQRSVDVAIFLFDLWSVRDALIRAHERGVEVRVVTDSDEILEPEMQALIDAGIEVLGDRREPLMHHKFVVIDGFEVWTGSMNFTVAGAYRNNNNLLRVRSSRFATNFQTEFDEMFVEDRFGALSRADTPNPRLLIEAIPVEVYFSPDDGVQARIVELIRNARESVEFMAFAFTADPIAEAMLERAAAGVNVRGVVETSQASGQGSEYDRLRAAGIDVRLDANPRNMHHKVILIDGRIVITGSYNFSRSAEEKNDENLIVLQHPELAERYRQEFLRLFTAAAP